MANPSSQITMNMPGTIGGAKITFRNTVMLTKIGIIGLGFVGNAIKSSMDSSPTELILFDIDIKKSTHKFEDLFDCEAIFICVPSPSKDSGECDTSILEDTLDKLKNYKNVIISKTTAPPDVYDRLNRKYPNLVHSPEFLTAANAVNDYLTSTNVIIGGSVKGYMNEAHRIIKIGLIDLQTAHFCSISEAAFTKYVINTFLATKVVYMNEMAKLAETLNINWEMVRNLIALDNRRIGNSHTKVPGFDGLYGFGGMCFPKDTLAFLKLAEKYETSLEVLDAAVKKNTILRLTEPK